MEHEHIFISSIMSKVQSVLSTAFPLPAVLVAAILHA
jgi:hypothetical protein